MTCKRTLNVVRSVEGMMKIDWAKAKGRMRYHAHDACGDGFYFSESPLMGTRVWWPVKGTDCVSSRYTLPDGVDWKQSLVKREGSNGD